MGHGRGSRPRRLGNDLRAKDVRNLVRVDGDEADRSFIVDGALNARGGVILASVINLANSLGMRVVAEGIESEEQAARLLAFGCNLGQGYYLGEPVAAREVHALLAVFPVVAPLHAPEFVAAPMRSLAPMAPRIAAAPSYGEEEPEELPSLFAVSHPPVKKPAKKSKKPATKAKVKHKVKAKKSHKK